MNKVVERLSERLKRQPKCKDVVGGFFRACPPASEEQLLGTENRLGFRMDNTLRDIYLKVANGGFGPGYGVIGVEGGFTDDLGQTVADLYEVYRQSDPQDPSWLWPEYLLPICHWGCIIYSAVDCRKTPGKVYFADVSAKEPNAPMETILILHKPAFEDWLSDWLDGKDLWKEFVGR